MISVIDEIAVCSDCLLAIANGDYSGLDYSYSEEEAETRRRSIDEGIASFAPYHLVPGESDNDEEFSRMDCDCCGEGLAGARHHVVVLGESD